MKEPSILKYPEINNNKQPAKNLMVLLHGVGSDGHDLIELVSYIQPSLPDYHFISPHGIEPYDMAPYGRQWFSLQDRNPQTISKLLKNNINALQEIITQKQQELGLTNRDTTIVGFSQGAMIGLYLTLINQEPFQCMIAFSGVLFPPTKCINIKTPICLIHGEKDEIVPIDAMYNASHYFAQHNIKYSEHKIAHLGHSIDGKGLEIMLNFIKSSFTHNITS